jgi:hypothetical protein
MRGDARSAAVLSDSYPVAGQAGVKTDYAFLEVYVHERPGSRLCGYRTGPWYRRLPLMAEAVGLSVASYSCRRNSPAGVSVPTGRHGPDRYSLGLTVKAPLARRLRLAALLTALRCLHRLTRRASGPFRSHPPLNGWRGSGHGGQSSISAGDSESARSTVKARYVAVGLPRSALPAGACSRLTRFAVRLEALLTVAPRFARDRPFRACGSLACTRSPFRASGFAPAGTRPGLRATGCSPRTLTPLDARAGRVAARDWLCRH